MKATLISKENNQAKFTLVFTAEELEQAQIDVYKKEKDKFQIDGFRKGKAPRSIIEKMYGNVFLEDAIDNLLNKGYGEAITELELEPIDRPAIDFGKIEKGSPLEVTAEVALFPEVEVKDYKGVEIEKVEAEVTDEDIEAELKSLQRRNSRLVTRETAAEDGDTVTLDYKGCVDGVPFDGGSAEDYKLKLGSGQFIPGFEEQLVGVAAGESKDVVVTFPEEYHAPELAGKEAVFACTVKEVSYDELPEINDDLIGDTTTFETVEEFKAEKRKSIEAAKKASAESEMKNAAMDKVVEANDIEVPASMVEQEVENMIAEFNQQLMYQGLSVAQYIEYTGKTMDDFRAELKGDAEVRAKSQIILRNLVRMENIVATEEEIEEQLKNMSMIYNMSVEDIKNALGGNTEMLANDIRMKNAIELVYSNAVIK